MPILAVNVDHVATLRQQRLGIEPDPVLAAGMAELAGAKGLIVHLREDRRHIQDRDVAMIRETCQTKFNLEMAATDEMQKIALDIDPDTVCLVPEKREELTTEGGLNVADAVSRLKDYLAPLHERGVRSSLFIDADPHQIEAAKEIGSEYIELHTGHYADAKKIDERKAELEKILNGIAMARDLGLKVNLGHGLNYVNVMAFRDVPGVSEYSIGHSIISRSIFTGITEAVGTMVDIVESFVE